VDEVASVLDLSQDAVKRAYKDFGSKNNATGHLQEMPYSLE
jgi:hypothetical protein